MRDAEEEHDETGIISGCVSCSFVAALDLGDLFGFRLSSVLGQPCVTQGSDAERIVRLAALLAPPANANHEQNRCDDRWEIAPHVVTLRRGARGHLRDPARRRALSRRHRPEANHSIFMTSSPSGCAIRQAATDGPRLPEVPMCPARTRTPARLRSEADRQCATPLRDNPPAQRAWRLPAGRLRARARRRPSRLRREAASRASPRFHCSPLVPAR
jgi:hypothetical protein